MFKPYGMIPALPTPFNEDGSINFDGLENNIEHVIKGGVHCLLALGSAGEYSLMTLEERKQIIKFIADKTNNRVPLMVGTSCHPTEDTIKLSQYAEQCGADCVLVLPPYYMQTDEQGIKNYYEEITNNLNIGVVIYHYPEGTNVELSPEFVQELSNIPGIVGIKNTTDQMHTNKIVSLTKNNDTFSVLTGFEQLILPTLSVGGKGAVGLAMNVVPEEYVKMYDNFVSANNIELSSQYNHILSDFIDLLEEEPPPAAVKAALDFTNLSGGVPRKPLLPASKQLQEKVKNKIKEIQNFKVMQ
jgi:4-hydroxy-tetrahydrodipicolinate synthase